VLVPVKYRTYGDWRGYVTVQTRVGGGGDGPRLMTSTTYLRGMDGDVLPGGGSRSVSVTDSQGGVVTDHRRLAGFVREQVSYLGETGTVWDGSILTPWISAATATDGSGRSAHMVEVGQVDTRVRQTLNTAAAPFRTTRVVTGYDGYGRVVSVSDLGGVEDPADDLCTVTSWTQNTSSWIFSTPATTRTVSKACGQVVVLPGDLVAATQTFYDGAVTVTAVPSRGLVTRTTRADAWAGKAFSYVTTATMAYDGLGRPVSVADAMGRTTTTAYTPAAAQPTTQVAATNGVGHVVSTVTDPAVGVVTVIDVNGGVTQASRDGLGRVTAVWSPGHQPGADDPDVTYAYKISTTSANAVTTKRLVTGGTYASSVTLYDGLLRVRQSQTAGSPSPWNPTVITTRLVQTTDYDSRGLVFRDYQFPASGGPAATMVAPTSLGVVPSQHAYTYDGLGRVTADTFKINNIAQWSTATAYFGAAVRVSPPAGGTTTMTVFNVLGQPTQLRQYSTATAYDTTSYTYTPAGQVATVTDPAGGVRSYGYDLAGRMISAAGPDSGPRTATYNTAGQVVTTTDPRGQTVWYGYDGLGRPTQERVGSGTGTLLAGWTYDTAPLGLGRPATATRYQAGLAYTNAVTGYTITGQPTGATVTIPAPEPVAGTYTSAYTYTRTGQVATYDPPVAPGLPRERILYNYDALDQQLSMGASDDGTYAIVGERDVYGAPTQMLLGNTPGVLAVTNTTYEYGTHRLSNVTVSRQANNNLLDADITYTYTPAGSITSITDTQAPAGGDRQCFTYDYLQRLTQAWSQPGASPSCVPTPTTTALGGTDPYWTSYTYDTTGNRLSETLHATTATATDTTRTYTYPTTPWSTTSNTGPHRLTQVTQTGAAGNRVDTYAYDSAGQTTTRASVNGTQTLTWDAENNLASVTAARGTTSYLYDATGQRLIRRDPTGTTLYLGDTDITTTPTGATTATRYYTFLGQQVAVRTPAGVTSVITDPHNTGTHNINTATGAITATRRTNPFGQPRTSTGTWQGSHGFVNGTQDPTGLTQLGARAYDPTTGRFTSPDPITNPTDPQQLHGYTYANNNPTNLTDPDGLEPFNIDGRWHDPSPGHPGLVGLGRQTTSGYHTGHSPAGGEARSNAGNHDWRPWMPDYKPWKPTVLHSWTSQGYWDTGTYYNVHPPLWVAPHTYEFTDLDLALLLVNVALLLIPVLGEISVGVESGIGAGEAVAAGTTLTGTEAAVTSAASEAVVTDTTTTILAGTAETEAADTALTAAKAEVGGGGQIFTHFTDADGVAGIAGVGPLNVGESVGVGSLKFGQGGNRFLAGAAGDNFVTDLGVNASARQLEGIGVFGAKQQYAIQFSQEAAFNSGVRPVMVKQNIFTIPGGSCISGACVVTRVR
jgi:RHS repeat-associated protein